MTTPAQHIVSLPLGQPEDPGPELVAAVAEAMNNPELVALADQLADQSVELIGLVASRQIMEHAVMAGHHTGEAPAGILQQALVNMAAGIEIAKIELERSDRRLAAHRCSPQ